MSSLQTRDIAPLEENVQKYCAAVLGFEPAKKGWLRMFGLRSDWSASKSHYVNLVCLGGSLVDLYDVSEDMALLKEAIRALETALQLVPVGHDLRVWAVDGLGCALQRACLSGDTDAPRLAQCVQLLRTVSQLRPPGDPGHAFALSNLAHILCISFEQQGDTAAL
jgi:hypothetical protein